MSSKITTKTTRVRPLKSGFKSKKFKRTVRKTANRPKRGAHNRNNSIIPRSLPVATTSVMQNTNRLVLGSAPYHETYGTGMRLESRCQIGTIVRTYGQPDYLVFKGTVGTTSTLCDGVISSHLALTSGTSATFASGIRASASSFTSTQFALFDKYNFREYTLEFVQEGALTTRGSVVVVPRFNSIISNRAIGGTPSYELFAAFPKAVEFGAKMPVVRVPIVRDRDMRKAATVLFEVDTEPTLAQSNVQQFHVCFAATDFPSSGDEVVSRVFASCIIDLYGPHPVAAAPLPEVKQRALFSSTAQSSCSSSASSSSSLDLVRDHVIARDYVVVQEAKESEKKEEVDKRTPTFRSTVGFGRP